MDMYLKANSTSPSVDASIGCFMDGVDRGPEREEGARVLCIANTKLGVAIVDTCTSKRCASRSSFAKADQNQSTHHAQVHFQLRDHTVRIYLP
jgi:hypothetical protein